MATVLREVPRFEAEDDYSFLTKQQVDAFTDEGTLSHCYESLDDLAVEIKAFMHAKNEAQIADEDWLYRTSGKLAFVNIAKHWVEKRMLTLGFAPPYSPTDPRGITIRKLEDRVVKLKHEVDRLKAGKAA